MSMEKALTPERLAEEARLALEKAPMTSREHFEFLVEQGIIDRAGRIAAHTGAACIDWCGHRAGRDYSMAGNMLAGPRVLADTAAAFEAENALPLALRLIVAMEAGEAAGGDKRGRQAAALIVCTTEAYRSLDLRVDDHAHPIASCGRG